MYNLPQEIEVWYIIPAIRKELSKVLISEYKLSYEKTGNLLGVSKAAISQYISNKRANNVKLSDGIKKEVKKSAGIMAADPKSAIFEIQRILEVMKNTNCSCNVCKKYNKGVLDYCSCQYKY